MQFSIIFVIFVPKDIAERLIVRKIRFLIASIRPSDIFVQFLESIEKVSLEAGEDAQLQIIVSCNYTKEQIDEFYAGIDHLSLAPTLVVHREDKGMLARFNRALEVLDDLRNDDILLFCNDDLVLDEGFIAHLKNFPSTGYLSGPLVRGLDGRIQKSVFRKYFTPWLLFFRIYDGGLYSFLLNEKKINKSTLNRKRKTVDGCCFIFPGQVIREIGGRFDTKIYLYYEELYFQHLVKRLSLDCFVDSNLTLIHIGGGSVSHHWSIWRSRVQRASRIYAARQYLGCGSTVIALLYLHSTVEMWIRGFINLMLRR